MYRSEKDTEINQSLGKAFEFYVDDLLDRYLPVEMYHRIPTNNRRKTADLVITTAKYHILIEQKFSLLNLSLKDTVFDLNSADRWLQSIIRAFRQLHNVAEDFRDDRRVVVKLVLVFEDLFVAEGVIKERAKKLYLEEGYDAFELERAFLIDIGEFEMLVSVISKEQDLLDRIFTNKITREKNQDYSEGVEFRQIMKQFGVVDNEYIKQKEKMWSYKDDDS